MREYKPELGRFAGQDIRQGIAQIPLSKFVSPDGHREVIYDANGNIVTASEDVGTYNFYPSNKNGFLGFAGHACHDVIPWIWWGNSPDDTTTVIERIIGRKIELNFEVSFGDLCLQDS